MRGCIRVAGFGLIAAIVAGSHATMAARQSYIPGVFAASTKGPVELIAWAERSAAGRLRMAEASLEDVPILPDFYRVMINLPFWKPVSVFVGTGRVFHEDRPELLPLVFGARQMGAQTFELRVSTLEKADKVAQLFKRMKARDDAPGYVFIVIGAEGRTPRYYPVRIESQPAS